MEVREVRGQSRDDDIREAFAFGRCVIFAVGETEGGRSGVNFRVEEVRDRMSDGGVTGYKECLVDGVA